MRRLWAILASTVLVAAWGCGNSYDLRLNKTLEDMRYRKRLDDMLMPAPTEGKFKDLLIFVRPPKNLKPAKEFLLPLPEQGKFDLEASFLDTQKPGDPAQPPSEGQPPAEAAKSSESPKQSFHMVARVKRPKNPAAKKKAPEPVNRGDFSRDALALINSAYAPPIELTIDKFKDSSKKLNKFKHFSFAVNEKTIQVYLYTPRNDPYEVAMIFEYPSTEHTNLYSKIDLCLESFAVGLKAEGAFSGAVGEEQPAAGAGGPAPGVF